MKEKQIEEMARVIRESDILCDDCGQYGNTYCAEAIAKVLTENGYRKQIRGKWISVKGDVIFKCSICDAEISTSWDYENDDMWDFCPCCGARMKGGEQK